MADEFLAWRNAATGPGTRRLEMFCKAFGNLLRTWVFDSIIAERVAAQLPRALHSCDAFSFDRLEEVLAYAILHLADRYGRVVQVLEQLLVAGRLPLRKQSLRVLDIGAGPAPSLYATNDFYADLSKWTIARKGIEVSIARLTAAHALDKGTCWDHFLHHLSECLLAECRSGELEVGRLPFRRAHGDLAGFSVHQKHHAAREARARKIYEEFDQDNEVISIAVARSLAYDEQIESPSAYDLIFFCNFLTSSDMPIRFRAELRDLALALTPGGVLTVIGAVGGQYPAIYSRLTQLASDVGLLPLTVGLNPIPANPAPPIRNLIAKHVREDVAYILGLCSPEHTSMVAQHLPDDVVDYGHQYRLPNFQLVAFVRQFRAS